MILKGIVKEKRGEQWLISLLGVNAKADLKSYYKQLNIGDPGDVKVLKVKEGRIMVGNKDGDVLAQPHIDSKVKEIWESLI